MTSSKKFAYGLFALVCVLAIALGVISFAPIAYAEGEKASHSDFYYGSTLDESDYALAQVFYDAMLEMDFTQGKNVVIDNPYVVAAAEKYTKGDTYLMKQFGAARDCFYYDQADLFYVDFDLFSINVSLKDGKYVVDMGAGRTDSYFRKGITAENVQTYIDEYNSQFAEFVKSVKKDLADRNLTETNVTEHTWTYWNAYCAGNAVCEKITYGFCSDGKGNDTVNSPFIRTVYGALVAKECVCEGYARLFKATMEALGFDCQLIYGSYVYPDGGVEPHMWTAVYDKTKECWYGVDPTFNDTDSHLAGGYLMISGSVLGIDHFPDPIISSAQFEMKYPELYQETINMPSGYLEAKYTRENNTIVLNLSYMGMNHAQLKKATGYHIAGRVFWGDLEKGDSLDDEKCWSPWGSVDGWDRIYGQNYFYDDGNYTKIEIGTNAKVQSWQVAIIDGPDDEYNAVLNQRNNYTKEYVKEHLVEQTGNIANSTYDPGYVAPAYVKKIVARPIKSDGSYGAPITNWQTSKQDIALGKVHIEVEYTQNLVKIDPEKEVTVECEIEQARDDNRTVELNNIWDYATLENFQWNGTNAASFDFMPSPMYQHNNLYYNFSLTNLQNQPKGEGQIGKAPNSFRTAYAYADTYVCTKCLGGGRYLIDNAYSMPQLVNDSDLSLSGWSYKDDSGKEHKVSEAQRSNMALVVTKPTDKVQTNMDDAIKEQMKGLELPQEAKVTSSTYEVDLQICGKIVSIPDGSYVKINLGFPEGIDYNNLDGVVFKLYHFKRNANGTLNYNQPEEIECIITQYGLVATVTSFSPYALIMIENAPELKSASKGITTDFSGVGGKVSSSTGKLTDIIEENGTITYTLNPYKGYQIEYAYLNGKAVNVHNGSVSFEYSDLEDNNIFSCGFVADAVVEYEQSNQIETMTVQYVAVAQMAATGADVTEEVIQSIQEDITQHIDGEATVIEEPELVDPDKQEEEPGTGEGDENDKPAEGDENDKPGEGDENDKPGEGDENDKPAEGDENDKPGEGDENDKPAEGDENDKPGEGDENDKPAEGDSNGGAEAGSNNEGTDIQGSSDGNNTQTGGNNTQNGGNSNAAEDKDEKDSHTGLIIGLGIAAGLLLIGVVVVAVLFFKKKPHGSNKK